MHCYAVLTFPLNRAQSVARLMTAKAVVDSSPQPSDSDLVDALHALTGVRAYLASGLAPGLRNDAPDSSIAMRQRWRLAELRAEEYAFVLLSRFMSRFAKQARSLNSCIFRRKPRVLVQY